MATGAGAVQGVKATLDRMAKTSKEPLEHLDRKCVDNSIIACFALRAEVG